MSGADPYMKSLSYRYGRLPELLYPKPTTCPAHGPLDESGGCAGCVAEDRATDAREEA